MSFLDQWPHTYVVQYVKISSPVLWALCRKAGIGEDPAPLLPNKSLNLYLPQEFSCIKWGVFMEIK